MSDPLRDRTSEQRMKRAEYRAWTEQQPTGRFERVNGVVVAMAPERISHARIKARIWQALDRAIRAAGLPCEALPDGITVEVGDSDYEPDAIVRCGDDLPGDMIGVPDPMIVVEVLSPSTSGTDPGLEAAGVFPPAVGAALPDRLGRKAAGGAPLARWCRDRNADRHDRRDRSRSAGADD